MSSTRREKSSKHGASAAQLEKERDALRRSYLRLQEELELLKRRLFIAKAERVDTRQLELEFAAKTRYASSKR